jgi:hypothetical protein
MRRIPSLLLLFAQQLLRNASGIVDEPALDLVCNRLQEYRVFIFFEHFKRSLWAVVLRLACLRLACVELAP